LIRRHVVHGKAPEAAAQWATTTDQANAELVAATARLADVVVSPEPVPDPSHPNGQP